MFLINKQFKIAASLTPVADAVQIKTDEFQNFVTGLAAMKIAGSATNLQIEIRDDYQCIFKFTDSVNWLKDLEISDKTAIFRPCNIPAKGSNLWINYKADSVENEISIVFLLKHTEQEHKTAEKYSFEQFNFNFTYPFNTISQNIILPTQFKNVLGVAIVGNDLKNFDIEIKNNEKIILQKTNTAFLQLTDRTDYDHSFFPIFAESNGRSVTVEITNHTTVITNPNTVKFALIFLVK